MWSLTVDGADAYDSSGGRTLTGEAIRNGFTDREHDADGGLIHFLSRAYDPGAGMLLQRDRIGFAAGDLNFCAYVRNGTDPSGLVVVSANT